MASKYIWIKNQRFYLYEKYGDYNKARKEATRQRKRNKCRYFIIKEEHGTWFPQTRYLLYLNKCIRLW